MRVEDQIAALDDEHVDTRREAAAWLVDHPELSRAPLRAVLEAAVPAQRTRWAAGVLARVGDDRDVGPLAALLQRSDTALAWDVAQALAQHPSDLALKALVGATRGDDLEAVGAAAVALGVRGDERGRRALEALLGHPDERVRYRAAHGLQRLGAERSAEALQRARAREASQDVRDLLDEVLGRESA